jgi:hypothetical protein
MVDAELILTSGNAVAQCSMCVYQFWCTGSFFAHKRGAGNPQ